MFTFLFRPVCLFLSLILPLWIGYRFLRLTRNKRNGNQVNLRNEWILILFVIYLGIVLAITIAPASVLGFNASKAPKVNIIPIINNYHYFLTTLAEPDGISTGFAMENIIGNLLLFMPLGIFLPYLFVKFTSFINLLAMCMLCSLLIETTQYILRQLGTYRTVDIDDIILNTLGGIFGWLIYSTLIAPYFINRKSVIKQDGL